MVYLITNILFSLKINWWKTTFGEKLNINDFFSLKKVKWISYIELSKNRDRNFKEIDDFDSNQSFLGEWGDGGLGRRIGGKGARKKSAKMQKRYCYG